MWSESFTTVLAEVPLWNRFLNLVPCTRFPRQKLSLFRLLPTKHGCCTSRRVILSLLFLSESQAYTTLLIPHTPLCGSIDVDHWWCDSDDKQLIAQSSSHLPPNEQPVIKVNYLILSSATSCKLQHPPSPSTLCPVSPHPPTTRQQSNRHFVLFVLGSSLFDWPESYGFFTAVPQHVLYLSSKQY